VTGALLVALGLFAAGRGEVFVDARDPALRPGASRSAVHGAAALEVGAGFVREDPVFALAPSLSIDASAVVPLWVRLRAPLRLRLVDRPPDDRGVFRRRDYDEVGDYLAILEVFAYRDDRVFRRHGRLLVDLWVGGLARAGLPSRILVADLLSSADLDRRRSGLSFAGAVEGRLAGQPARVRWKVLATDLAMQQVVGGAVALSWAGAFVGIEGAGDPTAPRALVRDARDDAYFALDGRRTLVARGDRGAGGIVLSLGYRFADAWRVLVGPFLHLVTLPGLGRGLAVGIDGEFLLAPDRSVRLGVDAAVTVGDEDFDPAYFGPLYVLERWQMPFAPGRRPDDLGATAVPKWAFVDREDLAGVGGRGRLRLAVGPVVALSAAYGYRPGPLGGQFDAGIELHLPAAELDARVVHRGRHGFSFWDPAGTYARLALRVPVVRWVDVIADAWLGGAMRPDEGVSGLAGPTGFVGSAGQVIAGVAAKIPW